MIRVQNLKKTFGEKEAKVQALRGMDLSVDKGESVAIMGKSGSGKSTLLNVLGGLVSMDEGKYWFDGNEVNFKKQKFLADFRRDNIGFVVQYFALIDDLNVFENIAMPLRYQGKRRKDVKRMVLDVLNQLDMVEKVKAYPDELSGGQQQRVAIARAIVKEPPVILADEPTGALDEETGSKVLDILERLHEGGKTIVIVTHDEKVAKRCDRIIHLKDGSVMKEVDKE